MQMHTNICSIGKLYWIVLLLFFAEGSSNLLFAGLSSSSSVVLISTRLVVTQQQGIKQHCKFIMSCEGENSSSSFEPIAPSFGTPSNSSSSSDLISASENLSVSSASDREIRAETSSGLAPLGIPAKFDKRRTFR